MGVPQPHLTDVTEEEIGRSLSDPALQAQLLAHYDGAFSLGITHDPNGELAILLRVEGDRVDAPLTVDIQGHSVRVLVQPHFLPPSPYWRR